MKTDVTHAMQSTPKATRAQRDASRRFYVWMAGTSLAIALIGFIPTYFLPLVQGQFTAEPVVHIHALILYSWVVLFCAQTWLVERGKILAHRSWGMLGIAIVTGMVFIVITIVSLRISQASQPGQPAGAAHAVRAFEWVSISGLVLYLVPIFVLGIVFIRRPSIHKRLMLLFTLGLLGAPIARWFFVLLAPPADPHAPVPVPGVPDFSDVPPPSVSIAPGLVGDLLVVVAMVVDWRTRGRPHPVYVVGLVWFVLLQVSVTQVAESPAWQAVATAIGHLAG
jgi:hypothetical protein